MGMIKTSEDAQPIDFDGRPDMIRRGPHWRMSPEDMNHDQACRALLHGGHPEGHSKAIITSDLKKDNKMLLHQNSRKGKSSRWMLEEKTKQNMECSRTTMNGGYINGHSGRNERHGSFQDVTA